jgi:sortase (surface protein transpeptidase)
MSPSLPRPSSRRAATALLIASLLALTAVVAAWAAWPGGGGSADLRAVGPVVSTSTNPSTTTPPPTAPAPTTTLPPGVEPRRLQIPSIGVEAAVTPVGLEVDGDMEIPPAAEVGWYRLGPRPGDAGSAVLAGHVDFNGQRGAFFDLRSVAVGAEVVVVGDGTTRRFVVTEREQIPKDQVDLGRYFTHDGPDRITLITCGGVFDGGEGSYDDNIIITARPVLVGAAP